MGCLIVLDKWVVRLLLTNCSCHCRGLRFPDRNLEDGNSSVWASRSEKQNRQIELFGTYFMSISNANWQSLSKRLCVCWCGLCSNNPTGLCGVMAHQLLTCPCATEVVETRDIANAESSSHCRSSAFLLLDDKWLHVTWTWGRFQRLAHGWDARCGAFSLVDTLKSQGICTRMGTATPVTAKQPMRQAHAWQTATGMQQSLTLKQPAKKNN